MLYRKIFRPIFQKYTIVGKFNELFMNWKNSWRLDKSLSVLIFLNLSNVLPNFIVIFSSKNSASFTRQVKRKNNLQNMFLTKCNAIKGPMFTRKTVKNQFHAKKRAIRAHYYIIQNGLKLPKSGWFYIYKFWIFGNILRRRPKLNKKNPKYPRTITFFSICRLMYFCNS